MAEYRTSGGTGYPTKRVTAQSPAEIIWSQIELGVKMSLGVREQRSTYGGYMLEFKCGPSRRKLTCNIEYDKRNDLYDIRCLKPIQTVPAEIIWSAYGVYAENLNEQLLRMEREVWG